MYFFFQNVGMNPPVSETVSLPKLALNIITDWMPGVPNSITRGFSDLLANVVETMGTTNGDYWVIKSSVKGFEKQWKQTTSWQLGVAFTRRIIEIENYRFWAPVSAFSSATNNYSSAHPYWLKYLKRADCYVKRKNTYLSKLLPDYIVARRNKTKRIWEVSFVESKGRDRDYINAAFPHSSWNWQSKNAEFYYKNNLYPATQNLLIATRINSRAAYQENHSINVRAWNAFEPNTEISLRALTPIIAMHYFGVCQRLGLEKNAELIAINNLLIENDSTFIHLIEQPNGKWRNRYFISQLESEQSELRQLKETIAREADEEITPFKLDSIRFKDFNIVPVLYHNPERSLFSLGRRNLIIGLTQTGLEVVKALQGSNDNFDFDEFDFLDDFLRDRKDLDHDLSIRNDGVIVFLSN